MLISISDQMGTQTDRLRCEVFQSLILIPINTGPLRHAVATVLTVYGIETPKEADWRGYKLPLVATVLTVYGIETCFNVYYLSCCLLLLQQCLPFTVLKHTIFHAVDHNFVHSVATVLTVYGIETIH